MVWNPLRVRAGKGTQTHPPYLVLLGVAGMWEVDDGGEVVHVRAAEAALEEVLCQQGADVGLAGACPAMQGKDQWFAGSRVLDKGLQCLPHHGLGQMLASQMLGQVTLQT